MQKTDSWPEFIRAALAFLLAYGTSMLGVIAVVKLAVKGWVDTAKEKSSGKTAIEELKVQLSEEKKERLKMQICIEEIQELEGEISALKKKQDQTYDLIQKMMEKQIEMLMRGNK